MANYADSASQHSRGYTLTEVLIVVIIIGLLGAVAAPSFVPADVNKVELAATRVAEAIRFARSEAIRTGSVHAAIVTPATERVRVEKTDITVEPVTTEVILYHPVNRNAYDFFVNQVPTAGVQIVNTDNAFNYTGVSLTQRVMFNAQGQPVFIKPISGETYHLTSGDIVLGMDNFQVTVSVAPYTGRVTIQ